MGYFLAGLFFCFCCGGRMRCQQKGKQARIWDVLVALNLLLPAFVITQVLTDDITVDALQAAHELPPFLMALPMLLYSRKHPGRWVILSLCWFVAVGAFKCYLFCVQQVLWSTLLVESHTLPCWVTIWLPDLSGFSG